MGRENREEIRSARQRLGAAIAAARDWHWGAVAGKVLLAGLGLVLLGAIGRSALAHSVLATDPVPALDGGSPATAVGLMLAANVPAPALPAAAAPLGTIASPASAGGPADGAAAAAPIAPTGAAASARGRATPEDPVYLNQATLADLRRLPGVGAKRADAILALRTRLGHFRQIEDLLKVKGVGRSSLRKLRPLVRLDPPPARVADAGSGDAAAP